MEKNQKSERVKRALGNLKDIILKKQLTINQPENESTSFDLFPRRQHEGEGSYVTIKPEHSELYF
jgi:hypothetical protein